MSSRMAGELLYHRFTATDKMFSVTLRNELRMRKLQARKSRLRIHGLKRSFWRRGSMLSEFSVSCGKVMKRLMDGRSHFSELFAGNYMFMQVTPSPLGA